MSVQNAFCSHQLMTWSRLTRSISSWISRSEQHWCFLESDSMTTGNLR